jgi:hypothetical protein
MEETMPNKPTPEQLDAIVRELREAEVLADMPNPAFEDACRYDGLCRQHMPAILDALEAKDAELRAARALFLELSASLGPYSESEFPTLSHKGSCGPESSCDTACMDAAFMSRHNAALARLGDYLAKYGEQGGKT